jgi:hypothetical protein
VEVGKMKMTFNVKNEVVNEVKKLVRKHNLYHEQNPFPMWTETTFYLEGKVKNFNNFNKDYWAILEKLEPQKPLFSFETLMKFLKGW